jgi:hypothetical protein
MPAHKITLEFNDKVVRQFLLATVIWGIGFAKPRSFIGVGFCGTHGAAGDGTR